MKDVAWGVIHGEGTIVCKCDRCGKKEEYPFDNGHPDFKSFQKKLFGNPAALLAKHNIAPVLVLHIRISPGRL